MGQNVYIQVNFKKSLVGKQHPQQPHLDVSASKIRQDVDCLQQDSLVEHFDPFQHDCPIGKECWIVLAKNLDFFNEFLQKIFKT